MEQFCNKCCRIRGAPHAMIFVTRATEKEVHLLRRHILWRHFVLADNNMAARCSVSYRDALSKQQNLALSMWHSKAYLVGLFYITEWFQSFFPPGNFLLTKSEGGGVCFYVVIGDPVQSCADVVWNVYKNFIQTSSLCLFICLFVCLFVTM